MELQLQLTLAPPTHGLDPKLGFSDAFGEKMGGNGIKTSFPRIAQSNDEDGDSNCPEITSFSVKKDEENGGIEGWPPIKSWRKKMFHRNQVRRPEYKYVKVKMEGVAIARKINPSHFRSYQDLSNSLISLFTEYYDDDQDGGGGGGGFTLIYQDREGDWLLLGDVPWQDFMGSVKRLEILRN